MIAASRDKDRMKILEAMQRAEFDQRVTGEEMREVLDLIELNDGGIEDEDEYNVVQAWQRAVRQGTTREMVIAQIQGLPQPYLGQAYAELNARMPVGSIAIGNVVFEYEARTALAAKARLSHEPNSVIEGAVIGGLGFGLIGAAIGALIDWL